MIFRSFIPSLHPINLHMVGIVLLIFTEIKRQETDKRKHRGMGKMERELAKRSFLFSLKQFACGFFNCIRITFFVYRGITSCVLYRDVHTLKNNKSCTQRWWKKNNVNTGKCKLPHTLIIHSGTSPKCFCSSGCTASQPSYLSLFFFFSISSLD